MGLFNSKCDSNDIEDILKHHASPNPRTTLELEVEKDNFEARTTSGSWVPIDEITREEIEREWKSGFVRKHHVDGSITTVLNLEYEQKIKTFTEICTKETFHINGEGKVTFKIPKCNMDGGLTIGGSYTVDETRKFSEEKEFSIKGSHQVKIPSTGKHTVEENFQEFYYTIPLRYRVTVGGKVRTFHTLIDGDIHEEIETPYEVLKNHLDEYDIQRVPESEEQIYFTNYGTISLGTGFEISTNII